MSNIILRNIGNLFEKILFLRHRAEQQIYQVVVIWSVNDYGVQYNLYPIS